MQFGKPSRRDTNPKDVFDEQFVIMDPSGAPIVGLRYKITTSRGEVFRGVTNERGETERVVTRQPEVLRLARDYGPADVREQGE